jgi:hypothetical protein
MGGASRSAAAAAATSSTDSPVNPSLAGRRAGAVRRVVGRGRGDAPQLHQTAERWIEPMKAGPIRVRRHRTEEVGIEPREAALRGGRRHRTEEGDIERKQEGPALRSLGEGGANRKGSACCTLRAQNPSLSPRGIPRCKPQQADPLFIRGIGSRLR